MRKLICIVFLAFACVASGQTQRVGNITVTGQGNFTVGTGTAPLVVSSTTRVGNLNVASAGVADSANAIAVGNITGAGTGVLAALANATNGSTGVLAALTPASGNVITGNGTAWVSAAPAGGGNVTGSALTSGNIVIGNAGNAIAVTATGSGVVTALGNATNASGGLLTTDGTATISGKTYLAKAPTAISASDIDWSLNNRFSKTLAANTTFTFSNKANETITVWITNTASNYTVTWPTVSWSGGTPPVQTIGAHTDIYTFLYDGTTVWGSVVQNF